MNKRKINIMNMINKNTINILVVDDEDSITSFIKMRLKAEGHNVYTASDGTVWL